jgi:hypothetical protein
METTMKFDEIATAALKLGYREKLRLALSLIQAATKEEEDQHPSARASGGVPGSPDPELVIYVAERLKKLKPSKKAAVLNSIGAMFQFRGGISDAEKEEFFSALVKKRLISLGTNGRIEYPSSHGS